MKPIYIAIACLCGAAGTVAAQGQLSKEITIEREIVPEVRAASRLNVYPRTLSFGRQTKSLDFNNYTDLTTIPQQISTLEPADTEKAAGATPYRGYVDGGYFPAANAGVSAGYSILGNEASLLNVWTQINNRAYKARPAEGMEKGSFRDLTGRVGVDFRHRFGDSGSLGVSTDVALSSFSQPWSVIAKSIDENLKVENQSIFGWNLSAMWNGHVKGNVKYNVGGGFNLFNFSKEMPADYKPYPGMNSLMAWKPVHQTGYFFRLGVSGNLDEHSTVGVDWNGDFISLNRFVDGSFLASAGLGEEMEAGEVVPGDGVVPADASGKTMGVVSLTPYYRFGNDVVSMKLGARVDITLNSRKKLHVAPDVMFAVNPASGFGAWLGIGGGEHLNTMQSLAGYSHYVAQAYAYEVSNVPVKGEFGLRFGPFKGASVTLDLAYAAANNWLMPAMVENQLMFCARDLRSWKAGVHVNWAFRKLLVLDAGFETLLGDKEKNRWMEWRDRARHVVSAAVSVMPVDALTVRLSYEMRMKRSMPFGGMGMPESVSLRDMDDLSVGVSYRVNDAFSVFARGENLLGRTYYLMPLVPAQGLSGLVGVGFKF